MNNHSSAVAIYSTHPDAEAALKALQDAGIDTNLISIIEKNHRADEEYGLRELGIPRVSVILYESVLRARKVLLVVHGASGEVTKANEVLRNTEPIELMMHGVDD